MINVVSIMKLAGACTPTVARAARNLPKMQKTVTSLAEMAERAKGSQIGELLAYVSEAGQRIAGHKGIVELEVAQAKSATDATIVRVIFKKGTDVVAKFATWVSEMKQRTGAFVNNSSYRHVTETLTPAEKFRALAEKLGVDIKVANERLNKANGAGVWVKDKETAIKVIQGELAPKTKIKLPSLNPYAGDPYFNAGYRRLGGDFEPYYQRYTHK